MKTFKLKMINCYEATQFISELLDSEKSSIDIIRKINLFTHLLMCESCKNYKQQLFELHNSFNSNEINHFLPSIQLSADAENRIQKSILEKINKI